MNFHHKLLLLSSLLGFIFLVGCHSHEAHEEDGEHESHNISGSIFIDEDDASLLGIEWETVNPGNFANVIKTSGTIEAPSSDFLSATAKKSGIISLAHGISEGARVMAGEAIASISSYGLQGGDITQAANINLQAAKTEYERLKSLYDENLVTASTFREAERAYKEAQALAGNSSKGISSSVTAPGNGEIVSLNVKNGEFVEAGTTVALIAKNSMQVLRAELPSRLSKYLPEIVSANFIPTGGDEIISLVELNGKKISGNSSSATSNGYLPVYFSFSGNSLSTPPGFVEVFLICGERPGVISVPRQALVEIQGNKYLYVTDDHHTYEKRLVKTGASDGHRVEILKGLSAGETIVAKGASVVRMAEVSSIAPPAHTHNH